MSLITKRYRIVRVTPSAYGATVKPISAWLTFDQAATLAGDWQEHIPTTEALNVEERFTGRIVSALAGGKAKSPFDL